MIISVMLGDKWFTLNVEPEDTIKAVKYKISKIQGIDLDFCLIVGNKELNDDCLKREILYTQHGEQGGGGFLPILFNSLNEPIIRKFTGGEAPQWRRIGSGLNLEGVCDNKICEAYRKKVWIQKGFGKFNMNSEVYSSQCPICHKNCEQVENMGLYLAHCKSRGRIQGEKEEKIMQSSQTDKNSFLTFQDKDETRVYWLYLQMEVTPLK